MLFGHGQASVGQQDIAQFDSQNARDLNEIHAMFKGGCFT